MRSPVLVFIILLLFTSSLFAINMEPDAVTAQPIRVPILKGTDRNTVFKLCITTARNEIPLVLEEVNIFVSGPSIREDVQKVEVLFSASANNYHDAIQFGKVYNEGVNYIVKGKQQLEEGENNFWISVCLNDQAVLKNWLKIDSLSVRISEQEFTAYKSGLAEKHYFGVALRKRGDDGVDTYRIPGLATSNQGTLIAVYDIRKNSPVDLQEDINVGMSRSTNGGQTWEPMKVIMDMGEWGGKPNSENGIGDPAILVDRQTNTIWVAAVWAHGHPGQRNWFASKPGLQPEETSQLILVKSEDDGLNWSEPINITRQVKDPNWHLLLQGPGKGICMQDGTLVFAAQYKDETEVPYSTIIWSSDHGKSWHIGKGAKTHTTEAQVIELEKGKLMLNMRDDRNRNNNTNTNGRAVYVSSDLGRTWEQHPSSNHELPEPNCMASLIKASFEMDGKMKEVVLFSNPTSRTKRDSITIKISFDDGDTWPSEYYLLLDENAGRGYSCMSKIDEKYLGILYEGSRSDLTFQVIPIDDILNQNQNLAYLFKSGTAGYATFRIPAIATTKTGRIIAFAEGRVNGSSDTGDIDLVMRSSDDGGKSWSPLKVIWDDNKNVCGNPAPVVDTKTGQVHLLMTWNLGEDHEHEIIEQKSKDTRRVFVTTSYDNGNNWTKPQEITSSVKKDSWTWYATGPGHGIQLQYGDKKGRLLIPCDHIEAGTKHYYSHVIYSDDNGQSWQLGGSTPQHQVNECTAAEFPDGLIILNMRNYDRSQKTRKISYSKNGGINWSELQADSALIEPICQAALLYTAIDASLWFLNPADTDRRLNLTLKRSRNYGKDWEIFRVLHSGASAYSDLCTFGQGKLGCLYEAGRFNPYEGIAFTLVNINN